VSADPLRPATLAKHLSPQGYGGSRMTLDVTLPGKRLRLGTRIAWVRPDTDAGAQAIRIGVQFIDASEEQRAEILSFARALARRPKIQRLVVASLALLVIVAAAAFWWSQRDRERERAEYSQELARTEAKHNAEISKTAVQYQTVANELDEQTAELNDLALRIRGLGAARAPGKAAGTANGSGQAAMETIRQSLAGVRERIQALEEQILPDGTCVSTDRCGKRKCCTWQGGLCLCDDCCEKQPH